MQMTASVSEFDLTWHDSLLIILVVAVAHCPILISRARFQRAELTVARVKIGGLVELCGKSAPDITHPRLLAQR